MSSDGDQNKMIAHAFPGEGHHRLNPFVGKWNARVNFFMAPGEPPNESAGFMENQWILGGRYLEQRYRSEMMGQPFEGRGLWGYCNGRQCYEGNWIDTWGTSMMVSRGLSDPSGRVFTMLGEVFSPGAGGPIPCRAVATIHDANRNSYDMFFPGPDGREMHMMSIEYTRA